MRRRALLARSGAAATVIALWACMGRAVPTKKVPRLGLFQGTNPPDPAVVPLLPGAFAGIHVAYGVGFLAGLWRWRGHFGPGRSRQPAERAERTTGPGR